MKSRMKEEGENRLKERKGWDERIGIRDAVGNEEQKEAGERDRWKEGKGLDDRIEGRHTVNRRDGGG